MSDAVSMAGRPAGSRAGLGLVLAMAGLGLLTFTRAGRELRDTVRRDLQVIRERDPAARSTVEIFLTYSGLPRHASSTASPTPSGCGKCRCCPG